MILRRWKKCEFVCDVYMRVVLCYVRYFHARVSLCACVCGVCVCVWTVCQYMYMYSYFVPRAKCINLGDWNVYRRRKKETSALCLSGVAFNKKFDISVPMYLPPH